MTRRQENGKNDASAQVTREVLSLAPGEQVSVRQTLEDATRILANSQIDLYRRLQLAERELARNMLFEKPWRMIEGRLTELATGTGHVERRLGFLRTTLGDVLEAISTKAA